MNFSQYYSEMMLTRWWLFTIAVLATTSNRRCKFHPINFLGKFESFSTCCSAQWVAVRVTCKAYSWVWQNQRIQGCTRNFLLEFFIHLLRLSYCFSPASLQYFIVGSLIPSEYECALICITDMICFDSIFFDTRVCVELTSTWLK